MRSERLARCPLCGGPAKLWHGFRGYHVECTKCGLMQKPESSMLTAITKWNRRTAPRSIAKKIEHAVYDFVVRSYGESEAYEPSWSIPDLARSVARDLANPAYRPVNKLTYIWEDT